MRLAIIYCERFDALNHFQLKGWGQVRSCAISLGLDLMNLLLLTFSSVHGFQDNRWGLLVISCSWLGPCDGLYWVVFRVHTEHASNRYHMMHASSAHLP